MARHEQGAGRLDDAGVGDAGRVDEFARGAGARQADDREVGEGGVEAGGAECRQDGLSDTAFGVVVFGDDESTGLPGGAGEGGGVDRLDGVQVDDTGLDAVGGEAFVEGDAGADEVTRSCPLWRRVLDPPTGKVSSLR